MIKLNPNSKISELENKNKNKKVNTQGSSAIRPEVVDAKVYKVRSAFVKNSVFITLSYVMTDEGRRPIEIFINSKDLNRSAEYVVLTRLISAIFRRATDPMFILEELHGIQDPNGGSFKDGRYYHSFYAEVAHIIERFFYDVGILEKNQNNTEPSNDEQKENELDKVPVAEVGSTENNISEEEINVNFRICPSCNQKGLKTENGCDVCIVCGYSKCDK
tara:strand:+ start:1220 stop:1873 length:654 start_codon:yes stop_codon:yes gene_type:complete